MTTNSDPDESSRCLECDRELDAFCFEVLGVAFVRYRCPLHGATALMEFLR